jgi:hypothetical protein
MTAAPGARRRTLQDDLLDDLRQAPDRRTAAAMPVHRATTESAVEPASAADPRALAVEVRISPRSWTGAGWVRRPGGDGVMINLGPVRLSLGNLRSR